LKLENEEGLPWTATTSVGWIILVATLTSGTAVLALGIYLSLWIRSKGRSALPLYGFLFVLFGGGADVGLSHVLAPRLSDAIEWLATMAWFVATLSLRYEIRQHYKKTEGWEPQINFFLTFFLSNIYINYCLNRFDLTLREIPPPTSLNLQTPPPSPNLRK
jgi:hypothetical protein